MLIDGRKAIPITVFVLDLVIVLLKAQNFDFEPLTVSPFSFLAFRKLGHSRCSSRECTEPT